MKATAKIEQLQEQGYTVKVSHRRPTMLEEGLISRDYMTRYKIKGLRELGYPAEFVPRGGATRVTILRGDETVAEGFARCSKRDNYSRRMGLQIALGRALKEAGLNG